MNDELEIDLRPYIEVLLKRWYLIIFIPLVAAVATYTYLYFQPPFYKASALVAITEADILVNFGSSIETLDEGRPAYQALPAFAMSSELVNQVYEALDPKPEEIDTLEKLAKRLEAESAEDLRLLSLTVTMPSAEDAARVANLWADLFIKKAHSVYGETDVSEVVFYEAQLTANTVALTDAENAVAEFEARNQIPIKQNELSNSRENQQSYLKTLDNIDIIIEDIKGLRDNLAKRSPSEPASFADQLSLITLQNSVYSSGSSLPIFLQFQENTVFNEENVGQQIKRLDSLLSLLEDKKRVTNEKLAVELPKITRLQEEIYMLALEQTHLNRTLELKRFLDTTLNRKVEEVKLTSQQNSRAFRGAGKAIPPYEPAGPRTLVPTAAVGAITGMLVAGIIVFRKYWQSSGLSDLGGEKQKAARASGNSALGE